MQSILCFFSLSSISPLYSWDEEHRQGRWKRRLMKNVIVLGLYTEKSPLCSSLSSFAKYLFPLLLPLSVASFSCLNAGSAQRSVLGPLTCSLDFAPVLPNQTQLPTWHLLFDVLSIFTYTKLNPDRFPPWPIHISGPQAQKVATPLFQLLRTRTVEPSPYPLSLITFIQIIRKSCLPYVQKYTLNLITSCNFSAVES